jgi:hypothetical protein
MRSIRNDSGNAELHGRGCWLTSARTDLMSAMAHDRTAAGSNLTH